MDGSATFFLPFKMLVKKMVPPLGYKLTAVGNRRAAASVTDNMGRWVLFGCCQVQTFKRGTGCFV